MRFLFCRVGWMQNYKGQYDGDQLIGGGSYVEQCETGSEIHNFTVEQISCDLLDFGDGDEELADVCLGYVHYRGQIKLERLGAKPKDEYIDNVLVFWVAPHPDYHDDRLIGWYRNARVYRRHIDPEGEDHGESHYMDGCVYNIIADVSNCVLLPECERTYKIPRAKGCCGGIGQANVWYADGLNDENIIKGARKKLNDYYNDR